MMKNMQSDVKATIEYVNRVDELGFRLFSFKVPVVAGSREVLVFFSYHSRVGARRGVACVYARALSALLQHTRRFAFFLFFLLAQQSPVTRLLAVSCLLPAATTAFPTERAPAV